MGAAEDVGKERAELHYAKYQAVRDGIRKARTELENAVRDYEANDFPTVHSKYDEKHACKKSKIVDRLDEASNHMHDAVEFINSEWSSGLSS